MKLAIYGAGGLGRETLQLAQQIHASNYCWEEICFIDDISSNRQVKKYPVLKLDSITADEFEIVIAVGEPSLRDSLLQKVLERNFTLATLVHPQAKISDDVFVGVGSIIFHGVFISCDSVIGQNVLLQPNASIGHDCFIGKNSVVSSFANFAGNVKVGERVFIGMNAVIREHTDIGDDSVISMGAAVFSDITSAVIVVGNPARIVRHNESKRVFK